MKNKWSDSFQIKSHQSVGGQPPPFQVNKQQIFAFLKTKIKESTVHFFLEQHLSDWWKDVHHVPGFHISKEEPIKSRSFTITDEDPQNSNDAEN